MLQRDGRVRDADDRHQQRRPVAERAADHDRQHEGQAQRGPRAEEGAVDALERRLAAAHEAARLAAQEAGLRLLRPHRLPVAVVRDSGASTQPSSGAWVSPATPRAPNHDSSRGCVARRAARRRSSRGLRSAGLASRRSSLALPGVRRPRPGGPRCSTRRRGPARASVRGRCTPHCAQAPSPAPRLARPPAAGAAGVPASSRSRRRVKCLSSRNSARNSSAKKMSLCHGMDPADQARARSLLEHDLEHEPRADVGQQQQRRARVQPAQRRRPRQPSLSRPISRPANTSQPSTESTALWSQRHGFANHQPSSSVADSSAKPAATNWKVSRSSRSSGMPMGVAAAPAASGACGARPRRA